MTVAELIDQLLEMDPSAEVRYAHQPHWPFEYLIGETPVEHDGTVYLMEGEQLGYLPEGVVDKAQENDLW